MRLAFLQNMQKWPFFFIFYQKTASNDKIRQKNDQQLIGFLVLVKKCQNGAFPRIFIGARSNPSYKTCIPFWHMQSAWTPPPSIHKNYQSLILTLEWPGTWHNGPKKSSYLVKRARNLTSGGQNACSRVCFLWPEIKPKPSKTT